MPSFWTAVTSAFAFRRVRTFGQSAFSAASAIDESAARAPTPRRQRPIAHTSRRGFIGEARSVRRGMGGSGLYHEESGRRPEGFNPSPAPPRSGEGRKTGRQEDGGFNG